MKLEKLSLYILSSLLLVAVSCDDFFDINDSPNNPDAVPPEVLLPTVLTGAAFANANELNRFASVAVTYMAGAGGSPAAYDIYNVDGADFNNQWQFEIYGGALVNSEELIQSAENLGSTVYIGIAKIMRAYTASIATDLWGDVPYSQTSDREIPQPRIDLQRDIYLGNESLGIQSLFDLVREGITYLDDTSTTVTTPTTDDIAYGGRLDNWEKAANTLLLKFAMQISEVEPGTATAIINEVYNENNYIDANDEDLNISFGTLIGSQSPVFTYTRVSLFRDELIMSDAVLEALEERNDPRLDLFYTRPTGEFVTLPNGFRGSPPNNVETFSTYNDYVTGVGGEGPVRLVTNFQRAFIFAEAALTLPGFVDFGATNAQTYYTEGIRASMQLAGVGAAQIDAYLAANPDVAILDADTERAREQILTQKWIAWTGNGLEAYNDWRRTGYPVLAESLNAVGVDGTRPIRLVYTNEEIAANPNYNETIVQPNVPVWWDVD